MDTNTLPTQAPLEKPVLLQWTVPAVRSPKRGKRWYITAGVVTLLLTVQAVWSGNWLFALLIAGIIGFYAWERRLPKSDRAVTLTDDGIGIDGRTTVWTDVRSVWLLEGLGNVELHLERGRGIPRYDSVSVGGVDLKELIGILQAHTQVDASRGERFLDIIIRLLKI